MLILCCHGKGVGSFMIFSFGVCNSTGWVVSSTLAGATIGSFTGGALADKFGCTRTFQFDSVPLIVGAILRFLLILFEHSKYCNSLGIK